MAPVEVDYVRRSEDPGSPAEPTAGGSGAPSKKFEEEDGGAGASNDMPDSPESGDMEIDESAQSVQPDSQKMSSPAPAYPGPANHHGPDTPNEPDL